MNVAGAASIITGGASGLGKATVERFAGLGGRVAIFDLDEENGAALAKACGARVLFVRVDVADEASVQSGIAAVIQRFGEIHICVNYAGVGSGPFKTLGRDGPFPLEQFQRIVRVNLVGTFNVLRLAAEQMVKNEPVEGERGVIINTASIAAFEGQVGQAGYSASKAGIVGMTLPIARDLAPFGIRVNTIVPGVIDTPLIRRRPKVVEALATQVLNPPRLGRPEEVAHLASCIVENAYINAECIRIDGGIRMQPR